MKRHTYLPGKPSNPHRMDFSIVDIEPLHPAPPSYWAIAKNGALSEIAQHFINYVTEQRPHLFPEDGEPS